MAWVGQLARCSCCQCLHRGQRRAQGRGSGERLPVGLWHAGMAQAKLALSVLAWEWSAKKVVGMGGTHRQASRRAGGQADAVSRPAILPPSCPEMLPGGAPGLTMPPPSPPPLPSPSPPPLPSPSPPPGDGLWPPLSGPGLLLGAGLLPRAGLLFCVGLLPGLPPGFGLLPGLPPGFGLLPGLPPGAGLLLGAGLLPPPSPPLPPSGSCPGCASPSPSPSWPCCEGGFSGSGGAC